MNIPLKMRKSAGVRVSAAVHRLIADANSARDTGDWTSAAKGYREALDRDSTLAHIWIQYGHASKELTNEAEAEAAYLEAAALQPTSAEPHLHLGHVYKRRGDGLSASRSYMRAVQLDRNHPDALAELHSFVARGTGVKPQDLLAVISDSDDVPIAPATRFSDAIGAARDSIRDLQLTLEAERPVQAPALIEQLSAASSLIEALGVEELDGPDDTLSSRPALVFDVSDLISYFNNARLPTGIQRVQIETIGSALRNDDAHLVKVCAFLEHRDDWLEIPAGVFLALCRLSLASGDRAAPDWTAAMTRLQVLLSVSEGFVFPAGAYLLNLGTSWWLQNYFLFVRRAKATSDIRYVPFVHDFIPVMASEHCIKELTQDFVTWAIGAFEHADFFLVNSESTKRDLLKVGRYLGHPVDTKKVAVITLDADFRKPVTTIVAPKALSDWGVEAEKFVLFVSTIESRKNHLGAFEAWINLIGRHGVRNVPKLVCVGNRGWLNDAVYARLDTHEGLRNRVVMLSGLSDAELDLLYRSCLCTLYPSRYEGWGLPVTESLCHGKVPIVSDASSLPEAGGPFAVYFESGSVDRLTAALDRVLYDGPYRAALENKIATDFVPRSWSDIAEQMTSVVSDWEEARDIEISPFSPPAATPGAYHPIVRNFETSLRANMRSAEIYRAGAGWWGPDNWGCWTKPQGGRLEMTVPGDGALRLYLQLHGMPSQSCHYEVEMFGIAMPVEGIMAPSSFKWIVVECAVPPPDGVLHLTVKGSVSEDLAVVTGGLDPRVISIGVAGFFVCRSDDMLARISLTEALALGTLDDLSFSRRQPDDQSNGPAGFIEPGMP